MSHCENFIQHVSINSNKQTLIAIARKKIQENENKKTEKYQVLINTVV